MPGLICEMVLASGDSDDRGRADDDDHESDSDEAEQPEEGLRPGQLAVPDGSRGPTQLPVCHTRPLPRLVNPQARTHGQKHLGDSREV